MQRIVVIAAAVALSVVGCENGHISRRTEVERRAEVKEGKHPDAKKDMKDKKDMGATKEWKDSKEMGQFARETKALVDQKLEMAVEQAKFTMLAEDRLDMLDNKALKIMEASQTSTDPDRDMVHADVMKIRDDLQAYRSHLKATVEGANAETWMATRTKIVDDVDHFDHQLEHLMHLI